MLKAGYALCPRCGRATDDGYYYDSETSTWVQLKRSFWGTPYVELYTPPGVSGNAPRTVHSVKFLSATEEERFATPREILVECTKTNGDRLELKFMRSCPHCIDQAAPQKMMLGWRDLPTYVIAVIGSKSVGKSCWIYSLFCAENQNKVRHGTDSYFLCSDEVYEGDKTSRLPPTAVDSLGETNLLYIAHWGKPDEQGNASVVPVAQILLRDFAGETFHKGNEELYEKSARHFFSCGVGYDGVDAVVFVTDPDEDQSDVGSLSITYNRVNRDFNRGKGLLGNKPVAFVLNKVDRYFDNPEMEHIDGNTALPQVPLLTARTFAKQGEYMYDKSNIVPRVALETALMKRLHPLVKTASAGRRCAGFLIKATQPSEPDEDGKQYLDFSGGINVMDPLLWSLNQLDIFPINDFFYQSR